MTSATIPTSTSGIRLSLPVSDKPGYFLVDYDYGNGGSSRWTPSSVNGVSALVSATPKPTRKRTRPVRSGVRRRFLSTVRRMITNMQVARRTGMELLRRTYARTGSIMVGLGPRTPLLLRQPLPPRVLGSSARTLPKSPRQDIVRNKHGVPCCNSFFWTKKRNLCRRNHVFLHFFGVFVIQWMVNVFSCGQIYYKLLSLLTSMFEKGSIK